MKTIASSNLLTDDLSVPLNGVKSMKVDIDTGSGNLTIDRLDAGEPALSQVLADGRLQYYQSQGLPTRFISAEEGHATLRLQSGAGREPWFHLPWAASNGATEWQIHLNPAVSSDITARTGGGNVKVNLTGMVVTHVSADSGGGNLDVILPEKAADLRVDARSGAGNVTVEIGNGTSGSNVVNASSGAGSVTVRVPVGVAARICARTGMGRVMVDSRFSKLDKETYQSADYDGATNRVEITAHSGAGNVSISTR